MKRTISELCLLAGILGLAANAPAQVVQLKGGEVVVGEVQSPHEGGLTLRRLDNGGVLELTWDQLAPHTARRLREMAGLAGEAEGEVLVTADYVEYELAGGAREHLVGRISSSDETTITLRRNGVDYPIPRARIKAIDTRQVPATDLYTAAELYHEKLAEIAPGDDADKHIALAEVLIRVRDYDRAEEHLLKARELGNSKQPNLLNGKIQRLAVYKASRDEAELLGQIRVALARKDFAEGVKLAERFQQKFSDGKLRGDFEVVKKRLTKERELHLIDRVSELWTKSLLPLADKKAGEAGVGLDAAKDYAEQQMGREIRERVQKALQVDAEEVDRIWGIRLQGPGAPAALRYHYGIGSWLLGADGVLKGTVQEKAQKQEEKSEKEKELEKIRERIERAMERARQANQGQAQATEATPEQWWEDATRTEKASFLRAYYVEFGGDMKIEAAHVDPCPVCGGEGSLAVLGSSGKPEQLKCHSCRGTRFLRSIRAR